MILQHAMAWFRTTTTDSVVIMGKRTADSIGRPLPKRVNIVLGRDANSLDAALEQARAHDKPVWVIGGAVVYAAALAHRDCGRIYLNRLAQAYDCDTVWPNVPLTEVDSNIAMPPTARAYVVA